MPPFLPCVCGSLPLEHSSHFQKEPSCSFQLSSGLNPGELANQMTSLERTEAERLWNLALENPKLAFSVLGTWSLLMPIGEIDLCPSRL